MTEVLDEGTHAPRIVSQRRGARAGPVGRPGGNGSTTRSPDFEADVRATKSSAPRGVA